MDNRKVRLGLYRKIEIARKQLPQMDEEAFRALLRSEFGITSRKDMNIHQLSRLAQLFCGTVRRDLYRARRKAATDV